MLIAGLIGFGGAWVGSQATIKTQQDEAKEARQAEAREKRATVYTAYLNQARLAADRRKTLRRALFVERARERASEFADFCAENPRVCGASRGAVQVALKADDTAQTRLRAALNEVYVYGSRSGVAAADRMLVTFRYESRLDQQRFDATYSEFLDVMCHSPSPRPPFQGHPPRRDAPG